MVLPVSALTGTPGKLVTSNAFKATAWALLCVTTMEATASAMMVVLLDLLVLFAVLLLLRTDWP